MRLWKESAKSPRQAIQRHILMSHGIKTNLFSAQRDMFSHEEALMIPSWISSRSWFGRGWGRNRFLEALEETDQGGDRITLLTFVIGLFGRLTVIRRCRFNGRESKSRKSELFENIPNRNRTVENYRVQTKQVRSFG